MKKSLGRLPKGATIVGQYHTHADYSDRFENRTNKANDHFNSDKLFIPDINIHIGLGGQLPSYDSSYLATPSGIFGVMRKGSIKQEDF